MSGISFRATSVMVLVCACGGVARGNVIVGQIDTFEGNSTENWQVGEAGGTGYSPQLLVSGGPRGVGDGFLRVRSNGSPFGGPYSRLAVFNDTQWTGSWNGGFGAIRVDVTNLGTNDVTLRLVLMDAQSNTHVSRVPIELPAGSGWKSGIWVLNGADFRSSGGSSLDAGRANIIEMRFVHHLNDTGGRAGQIIEADIGVDNIEAIVIPEPGVAALVMGAAIGVLGRRRG